MPRGPIPRSVQKAIAEREVYQQQVKETERRLREEARAARAAEQGAQADAEPAAETPTAAPRRR